jgi:hypothetical protein
MLESKSVWKEDAALDYLIERLCLEASFDAALNFSEASEALPTFTTKVAGVKGRRFPPPQDAREETDAPRP